MNHRLTSIALAGFTALFLAACATAPAPKTAEAKPAAPALSDEAKSALSKAEADIKAAAAKYALWTTAESALKAAQDAAKAGDSAKVIAQSKEASTLAALGIEQTKYPSTEQK